MSSISFAQQNHLASLITARISDQIQAIQTAHADELREMENGIIEQQLEARGLTAAVAQMQTYKDALKRLKLEEAAINEQVSDLRSTLQQELGFSHYYGASEGWWTSFNEQIHAQAQAALKLRAAQTEWGARLVHLETEQKALLDTIYLTTGNKEFAAVLARFNHLLGLSETPLQAQLSETRQLPPGAALQES